MTHILTTHILTASNNNLFKNINNNVAQRAGRYIFSIGRKVDTISFEVCPLHLLAADIMWPECCLDRPQQPVSPLD